MQAAGSPPPTDSRRNLPEHFGMQFRDPNQRLCRSARNAPSLLPLFQGALRDSEQRGELRLRQAGFQARAHDRRARLNRGPFATASLDFTHTVQNLLPDVAVRLESGERAACELLSHVRTPPSVVSEYGPARSPVLPWHKVPASRTLWGDSTRSRSPAARHACLRLRAASDKREHDSTLRLWRIAVKRATVATAPDGDTADRYA